MLPEYCESVLTKKDCRMKSHWILFLRKGFSIGEGLCATRRLGISPFQKGLQKERSLDSLLEERVFYWRGVVGYQMIGQQSFPKKDCPDCEVLIYV